MARITKTRTKKPLAEGLLSRSWSKDYTTQKETFSLCVEAERTPSDEARFINLKMSLEELREVMVWAAPFFFDGYRNGDRFDAPKKASEALRELADELERAGK